METHWDFVEKYYPHYYTCNDIALSDDLQKLIDGTEEEGSDAERLLFEEYESTRDLDVLQKDADALNCKIYRKAIEGYLKTLKK